MDEFDKNTEAKLAAMASGGAKVLVTGGSGYLGSVLVEMLIQRGFHVTVVDNLQYAQNVLFNLFSSGRLKFVRADVTNEKLMADLLQKGDYEFIFPLAAIVGFQQSEHRPEVTWLTNHGAIVNLLKHRKASQKIIFPNTNSGYGATSGQQMCTEDSPLTPISMYSRSKAEAEKAVMASGNAVCFRLATLFGFSPRMRTDLLVNDFVLKALSEKAIILFERNFRRNVLHVRDAARGFLWAMANWESMKNRVYNLGHPDYNFTKEELCQLIKKHIPDLNIFFAEVGEDPDKRNYMVSNERMLKTGFTFKYGLEGGIMELIAGYQSFKDVRFKNF